MYGVALAGELGSGYSVKCRTLVGDWEEKTLLLLRNILAVDQGPGNALAILLSSVLPPDYRWN